MLPKLIATGFSVSLDAHGKRGKANIFVRPATPLLVDQPLPELAGLTFGYDKGTALGDIGFNRAYA